MGWIRFAAIGLVAFLTLALSMDRSAGGAAQAQSISCGLLRKCKTAPKPAGPLLRYMIHTKWLYDIENPPADMPAYLLDNWREGERTLLPDVIGKFAKALVMQRGDWTGVMDGPLCVRAPTLYLWLNGERWGYHLYQNGYGSADLLMDSVKQLVEANCKPGTIEAVRIVVSQLWMGRPFHPITGERIDPKAAPTAVSVYKGMIVPSQDYILLHDEPDGYQRYLRQNGNVERRFARREEKQAYRERAANVRSAEEFCQYNAEVCLIFGVTVAAIALPALTGQEPAGKGGETYGLCIAKCDVEAFRGTVEMCKANCAGKIGN